MAVKVLLVLVVLIGCAAHAQYRVTVPGTGNTQAFIAENPKNGSNGACYDMRTTDPTTGLLHDAGELCGLFYAAGYANAGVTISTVTGDSVFQPNTTFLNQGMITGGTAIPPWMPVLTSQPGPYTYLVNGAGAAFAIIEASSGGNPSLLQRNDDAPTGAKLWEMVPDGGGTLHFRTDGDSYSPLNDWLAVARSGATPTSATFSEHLLFSSDNSYNVGSSTSAAADVFATGFTAGRALARQGSMTVANISTGATFAMLGTAVATGGADLGVGNLIGSSSIYPINSSVNLGAASFQFANEWVVNLTVSGTCTGCSGTGANTTLSNLTNPTAINQDLLFGAPNLNVGSLTQEAGNLYAATVTSGTSTLAGAFDLFNGVNSNQQILSGSSVSGSSVDVKVGNPFFAGSLYGISNVTLGNSSFPWSTLYVTNVNVGGSAGFSGTKTAGACTITISSGIITAISGC